MTSASFDRRAIPSGAQIRRWPARDGWSLRSFVWPAVTDRPRGSILFQGGRGDIFEKYLETFAHWHGQGWTITSFDWRGQGGSGRLTDNPNCGHIDSFDRFVDDFRDFHGEWHDATPGPHVVMGHSMGGHLVLRALVEGAARPDAAVLIAPMLGVKSVFGPFSERLARMLGGVGNSARPAWKGNERPHTTETREELLTHGEARYQDEIFWQQSSPELLTGPPSWRWVIESFKSMKALRRDPRLRTMGVPVLGLIANADGLVDPKVANRTLSKLPDARLVQFGKESAHEILREVDKVRNRAIGEIDLFLEARVPRR
ncbi:MAG: alpha/beta fold hydrolase [Pseudomonadota bacterium]